MADTLVPIKSREEVPECYEEFLSRYKENPNLIKQIRDVLSLLNYSDKRLQAFDAINSLLPKILGVNGARYLLHILSQPIIDKEEISQDLLFELSLLQQEFGIAYVCLKSFYNNPYDFAALEFIGTSTSENFQLVIYRSDGQNLILNPSFSSLSKLTEQLLKLLNEIMETKELTLPQNQNFKFIAHIFKFLQLNGLIKDEEVENYEEDIE